MSLIIVLSILVVLTSTYELKPCSFSVANTIPTGITNVGYFSWHPSESRILIAQRPNVLVYDANLMQVEVSIDGLALTNMDWSPDGSTFASVILPRNGESIELRQIWDINTSILTRFQKRDIGTVSNGTGYIPHIEWAPDNSAIINTDTSGYIYLWRLTERSDGMEAVDQAGDWQHSPFQARWNAFSDQIASGGTDYSIRLWSVTKTGLVQLQRFDGYKFVAWNPSERRFASIGLGNQIQIVDTATMRMTNVFGFNANVVSGLDWSAQDIIALTRADSAIEFYSDLGELLHIENDGQSKGLMSFNAGGNIIAYVTYPDRQLVLLFLNYACA